MTNSSFIKMKNFLVRSEKYNRHLEYNGMSNNTIDLYLTTAQFLKNGKS